MKITIEPLPPNGEEEIVIRTDNLDDSIMELIYSLKTQRSKLVAFQNGEILKLSPDMIYYFESVDNRVCACCEKAVCEVKQKLYELEAIYSNTDFVRISKAMIVNVSKITRIVPMFNGRMEAVLSNGERVVISRQYMPDLKKKLGI